MAIKNWKCFLNIRRKIIIVNVAFFKKKKKILENKKILIFLLIIINKDCILGINFFEKQILIRLLFNYKNVHLQKKIFEKERIIQRTSKEKKRESRRKNLWLFIGISIIQKN